MATRRAWGAIRLLPSGRWQASYRDSDTGKLTPADHTFATKKAADIWLSRKRAEIDAGTAVDERSAGRPLSDFWPAYERTLGGLKASTKVSYATAWRLRIEPRFGATRVRRIKRSSVDEWVSEMIEEGLSRSIITESLGVLKRVLDRAVRDDVIAVNPCSDRGVKLPRKQQIDRPVLSPAEVERIASECRHHRDQVLIRFLVYSGARISEAFALQWSAVDLERRIVTIKEGATSNTGKLIVGPTKTYASRKISIPARLSTQLSTYKGDGGSGIVFPNAKGGYLIYSNWRSNVWDPAIQAAGIKALPHDLRATCASLLIDAGASPKDVQQHLGHSSIAVTMDIYARVRGGRSDDLAARLDALIAETG